MHAMPIYDYECRLCGEVTEVIDPPPKCCGRPTRKKVTKTSFHLKGRGWASDGYGLKPGNSPSDSE